MKLEVHQVEETLEVEDVQVTLESEALLSLGSPDSAYHRFWICHKKIAF